ncbi:nitric oxide reductase transcriptional regulator NorR [Desulforhopalus sp. IMCC35007]|uniref:nitric oxide reductase transcriptional regulator NorR n=1 Tax=Desulforhopalus sp. IMCC35007 TaxID=2569543 RepID=UPI00145E3D1B|nr:nitric oxide reductase transcriptional regulator NorR [Desulforhopalus sp. IMCC35007]
MLTQLADQLTTATDHEERYRILLRAFQDLVQSDAVALLRMNGETLTIVACLGLSPDAMGRSFKITEHPRLEKICKSEEGVVFPSACTLSDPYDGLLETDDSAAAHVHSCMGLPLLFNRKLIGVLTADALAIDVFTHLDIPLIKTIAAFAVTEMHTSQLIGRLQNAAQKMDRISRHLVEDARRSAGMDLIGNSISIKQLRRDIELVARSDFSVLITGETGAGKEVVARAIHALSIRREHPLICLNCATLPQNLVDSELFGHVRGAFTGATTDRAGKLELAEGATLFLDEIGELPLDDQPKLLRFLQTGEVQRLGSNLTQSLNVRLLSATNRDLATAVKDKRFRADLFHRLNVYPIHVPPLREHPEDIPLIIGRYCEMVQRQLGCKMVRFRPDTCRALQLYEWPGNVRELENLVARAILRAAADQLEKDLVVVAPHHFGGEMLSTVSLNYTEKETDGKIGRIVKPLKSATDDLQRDLIQAALMNSNGNWAAAARELGINRSNLHKLAKRLNLK